jgi:predicted MFS family arabinose efflux permease
LVREFAGETEGGGNAAGEAMKQLQLLKKDRPFRNFVIVRALAIGSGLSAPFIVSLSHEQLGGAALWLGLFILVDGLAALLASPLLGKWADTDSRALLRFSMAGVTFVLVVITVVSLMGINKPLSMVFYPGIFFIMGVLHTGVRLGRKTYLVDMAEGNKRTSYVAVSNTLIGVLLLAGGLITGVLALASVQLALGTFAAAAALGFWTGRQLPEVSGDA